ncbi:MAG: hypothetical protein AAB069_06805, partial [Planctomycetota bacterium]
KLFRYTTLPVLLDLLRRKKIVLLDPSTWEDRNDAEIILEYKKKKKISKLFAICFSTGEETIHHWKTYADGISGCRIDFDGNKLLSKFKDIDEVQYGKVTYKKTTDLEKMDLKIDHIPFLKRWPYRCENEYRVIWEGKTQQEKIEIDIDLHSINKITISQQMPSDVSDSIKELLHEKFKNPDQKIIRSTLYENKKWINAFKNISIPLVLSFCAYFWLSFFTTRLSKTFFL